MSHRRITISSYLGDGDLRDALRRDAERGLTSAPKSLPPKWFYDKVGSELFDAITRLDEYYPTEAERSALSAYAGDIVRLAGADTLAELGSGSSDKTRTLLDAMRGTGSLAAYLPFDVSESALRLAATTLVERDPELEVVGVVGDFDRHLQHLPRRGRRLLAFLGGTIGNYEPDARQRLLTQIAQTLDAGEHLLLGTDLVKDVDRLVAAYDDASGVTAEFNKNVLAVLNRELGADFELDSFAHIARWDADERRIEMLLESRSAATYRVADLDLSVRFQRGERMLTEISSKFTREQVAAELTAAGFDPVGWWTDPAGDFGISLGRRGR